MRGKVARRLREEAVGTPKAYLRHSKTGAIVLRPSCWRAIYQRLKKEYKG